VNRVASFIAVLQDIVSDIFSAALILYCLFLFIESFEPGFVSFFIDLGTMTILVFAAGILTVALGGFARVPPRNS